MICRLEMIIFNKYDLNIFYYHDDVCKFIFSLKHFWHC